MAPDLNEEQLYARIEAHWDSFVKINHAWNEFIDRMALDGNRMIREALPKLGSDERMKMLHRFFRRYGCYKPIPQG